MAMPRRPRICPAKTCFHVLNRAVARLTLFEKPEDYEAFERVLEEAKDREPLPIFAYTVMPNHWHFVVRPESDSQLSEFFRWLTHTHTMRWHAHFHTQGTGHLYQGRFKAFPIEDDEHLLAVLRYVERNPLRASLVERAEDWKYGSLWRQVNDKGNDRNLLADWPIPRPRQWRMYVNEPQSEAEVAAIRRCVRKGCPYGGNAWINQTAIRLNLEYTLRSRGRPRKQDVGTQGEK
jgi:putative transposase